MMFKNRNGYGTKNDKTQNVTTKIIILSCKFTSSQTRPRDGIASYIQSACGEGLKAAE